MLCEFCYNFKNMMILPGNYNGYRNIVNYAVLTVGEEEVFSSLQWKFSCSREL